MTRTALVALLVLAGACRYRVAIETRPTPALLELPGGRQAAAPGVVDLRWAPWNRQVVRATAPGHRPVEVDLREDEIRFGRYLRRAFRNPRGRVELILVPIHGPSGSWSEDDVPGAR